MHAVEHYIDDHAPEVFCPLCNEMVEREMFAHHRDEHCPQRIVSCDYCRSIMYAESLFEHQERCGRRKERCYWCRKYIRRREMTAHLDSCGGSSSDASSSEERHHAQPARIKQSPDDSSQKQLMFTVAIVGVSVLLNMLGTFILLQVKK